MGAMAPITSPSTAVPAAQDQSAVRCTRQVSTSASASRGEPSAGPGPRGQHARTPGRGGSAARTRGARSAAPEADVEEQHPPPRCRPRRGAGSTSRTARATTASRGPVSPTARRANRTPMPASRDRRRRCARWRDSWQASAVIPMATQADADPRRGERDGTRTGARRRCPPAAASTPSTRETAVASRTAAGQQGVAADRRAAEQLGPAGLLVAPGVAADDDDEQQRDEHGVQHGHLASSRARPGCGRRGSARRAPTMRGAGVDRLGRRDPVGHGRVRLVVAAADA